jgi:predicted GIY-YIG superfamily endonuclease
MGASVGFAVMDIVTYCNNIAQCHSLGETSGVYVIEYANNEFYVGETENVKRRFVQHIGQWKKQRHTPQNQKAFNASHRIKYPIQFHVIECDERHRKALEKELLKGRGLNCTNKRYESYDWNERQAADTLKKSVKEVLPKRVADLISVAHNIYWNGVWHNNPASALRGSTLQIKTFTYVQRVQRNPRWKKNEWWWMSPHFEVTSDAEWHELWASHPCAGKHGLDQSERDWLCIEKLQQCQLTHDHNMWNDLILYYLNTKHNELLLGKKHWHCVDACRLVYDQRKGQRQAI